MPDRDLGSCRCCCSGRTDGEYEELYAPPVREDDPEEDGGGAGKLRLPSSASSSEEDPITEFKAANKRLISDADISLLPS